MASIPDPPWLAEVKRDLERGGDAAQWPAAAVRRLTRELDAARGRYVVLVKDLDAALTAIDKLKCEPEIRRDNHWYPHEGCSNCDPIAEFEAQRG